MARTITILIVGFFLGFISAKYIAIANLLKPVPQSTMFLNALKIQKESHHTPMENLSTAYSWPGQKVCLNTDGNVEIVENGRLPNLKSIYGRCIKMSEFGDLLKYYIDNTESLYDKILDRDL